MGFNSEFKGLNYKPYALKCNCIEFKNGEAVFCCLTLERQTLKDPINLSL
jgi:hypothetical protein